MNANVSRIFLAQFLLAVCVSGADGAEFGGVKIGGFVGQLIDDPEGALESAAKTGHAVKAALDLVPLHTGQESGLLPLPLDFDSLDKPYCSALLAAKLPGGTNGDCGAYGVNVVIPQRYFYGDRTVDIQSSCTWHDQCYSARWHGGVYTRKQCDDIFYDRMVNECSRKLHDCTGARNHCKSLVYGYYKAARVGTRRLEQQKPAPWGSECLWFLHSVVLRGACSRHDLHTVAGRS